MVSLWILRFQGFFQISLKLEVVSNEIKVIDQFQSVICYWQ